MSILKSAARWTSVAMLMMAACSCAATARPSAEAGGSVTSPDTTAPSDVSLGPWSGAGIVLRIEEGGARVEFDCAHGSVVEPFAVDSSGRFDLRAQYVQERPGPVRIGEQEKPRTARVSGQITESTMTFTLTAQEPVLTLGPFTLEPGEQGRLHKCR